TAETGGSAGGGVGGVVGKSRARHQQRARAVDRAAVAAQRAVVREGAAVDRYRSRLAVNRRPVVGGVLGDSAVVQGEVAVVEDPAAVQGRIRAGHGAVIQGERAFVVDPAGIGRVLESFDDAQAVDRHSRA